jgi:membrane-bound ClpP family serine protease
VTEVANEPAVVLVCVVLASALIVAEVALPTFGLAGITGFALVVVAMVGINDAGMDWWPLSLMAVAVGLWSVMIARRTSTVVQQGVAVGLFVGGGVFFGVLEEDPVTIVLALLGGAGVAAGFPVLLERSTRLMNAQPEVGMEAFVGRPAMVTAWAGNEGSVQLEGAFWNAVGPAGLAVGDEITITGYEGMRFTVRPTTPDPGGMPMTVPQKDNR